MTKDEALKIALEALIGVRAFLESDAPVEIWSVNDKAITAIKEALAQPQRTWQGLTAEEIDYIYTGIRAVHHDVDSDVLCRAIEAKLKEKNGA